MMQSQPPVLPDQFNRAFVTDLLDLLRRNYTDIFAVFDKTAVDDPAAMGNADGEIGGLSFSNPPTQAECNALRDKCEELADDVRAIHTTLSALVDSLQARGLA